MWFLSDSIYLLGSPEDVVASAEVAKDNAVETCHTTEKCSQSTFRSVTELSKGDDALSGFAAVNMVMFSGFLFVDYA